MGRRARSASRAADSDQLATRPPDRPADRDRAGSGGSAAGCLVTSAMTRRPGLGPQPAGPDDALSTDVPNSIAPHRAAVVPESRRPPRSDWTAGPQRLL